LFTSHLSLIAITLDVKSVHAKTSYIIGLSKPLLQLQVVVRDSLVTNTG